MLVLAAEFEERDRVLDSKGTDDLTKRTGLGGQDQEPEHDARGCYRDEGLLVAMLRNELFRKVEGEKDDGEREGPRQEIRRNDVVPSWDLLRPAYPIEHERGTHAS